MLLRPHATFTGFNDAKKRFSQLLNKVINSYTMIIALNNRQHFYLNNYSHVGHNWITTHGPDLTSRVSQSGEMQTGNSSSSQ